MVRLETFPNLDAKQKEVLSRSYFFGNNLKFSLKTPLVSNTHSKHKLVLNEALPPALYSRLSYIGASNILVNEVNSSGIHKLSFEQSPSDNPNIKLAGSLGSSLPKSTLNGTVELDYSKPNFRGNLSVSQGPFINFSAVLGSSFGVGLDLNADLVSNQVSGLKAALWYAKDNLRLMICHHGYQSFGNASLSGMLSKGNLNWAAEVTSSDTGNLKGETGISYTVSPNFQLKTKVSSKLEVCYALKFRLLKSLKVTWCTLVDISGESPTYSQGFKIAIH